MDAMHAGSAPLEESGAPPSVTKSFQALWDDVQGIVHDHLELAALEAQRAGESLVAMFIYGIVAALFIASTWLGLMAAGTVLLINMGVALGVALLMVVFINILGVLIMVTLIRFRSKNLRFPATVRSLKPNATSEMNCS